MQERHWASFGLTRISVRLIFNFISYCSYDIRLQFYDKFKVFAALTSQASKTKKRYASAGLLACGAFARGLCYTRAADWLFEKVEENVKKALDPV